jgi:hypothetical protein
MKRSFTFTMSRKVSTRPYENVDVFVPESSSMPSFAFASWPTA